MLNKYKEKAIPLISVDQASGKYILTPEASEFIRSVPGPIGVVSVAGLYRTGKSYLLNQMLLNRSNGFGVGPTINPCTKGLWCWGTPIKGETADGQKLNIIVIDTEGIGALDEDQTHDTRIFTLAILASSCFIYNSVGSIDENAVQNLSLVVNLTKHIQVRTQKYVEEEDPDKIASHFPTFFWVVRDFSLQISDTDGNKMTSKEYLEKALAPQKGFSEDIDEKNRIRRMLTSFFKQRQCFTLVRPLIQQSKLQDLDKMSFDDLRPEFVNQVINFRKRVTGRMKPKTLNGQKLSGELYLSMLSSYVGAINDGAVPNIENAWNYMCQEQCTKVMTESLETFETQLREIKIPCSGQQINRGIEAAQEAAYEKFKKKSIGDDAEKYYKELQSKMRERTKQLRKVNAEEGKGAFKKYIAPFVATIQQKISKEQFSNFEDFLEELKKLEEKVTKQGPNYVDSNLNCQICINKILGQGVTYLFKRMKNERQQIKKTLEQRIKINENQVDCLKKERESEQTNVREKLTLLDRQKVELTFKLEKIQIELDRATREKATEGETLSKNLSAKKAEIEQIRRQFENKITEANNRVEETNKKFQLEQNNWQKERAIYELKVKQQSERLEELEKRVQTSSAKLAVETSELSQKHREQTLKFQDQIQELTKSLSESKQKNQRLEEKELQMREKIASLTEKFETTDRKLREQITSRGREVERMKNQHESEINRVRNEMMQSRDENDKVGRQMEEKFKKQEGKARELAQELKNVRNKYQKENQVLSQELQFAKRGFEQTKQKLVDAKTIFEDRIAAIEADSGLQREEQTRRKIAELKSTHEDQIRSMQSQYKESQRAMTFQMESLTKMKNQLELRVKVLTQELTNQKTENEQVKQNLNAMYKQLENEMKVAQREKVSQILVKQGIFNEKIAILERQLEETRENYHNEKIKYEESTALQFTMIKNDYEVQKEHYDARHNEEKEKLRKNYRTMTEDYEKRIRELTESHEQELQQKESEYEGELRTLNTTLNELSHQKQTLAREKINLEQKFSSLNERYNKMELDLNQRLQKLLQSTKIQRDTMTKKLEELQFNKNQMQKQILSLTHERDQYRGQSQKQTIQIDQMKAYSTNLNERYEKTKFTLEQKLKDSQETYLRQKSRFETENALLQQKKDFSEQKIAEIEKDLRTLKDREQEQIKSIRDRYEQQMSNLSAKAQNQRRALQEKIEKIKKASTEAESNFQKQYSEISKAKAIDQQKIEYLEKKLMETESKTSVQISSLNENLKALRQKFSTQTAQLRTRVLQLEQSIHLKQNQLIDMKNSSEIKIALSDIKFKNLQQSSQTSINESKELIKTLEKQLSDFRTRSDNDKNSQLSTHQQILRQMQGKYRNEITQLNNDLSKRTQQIQYITKDHEKSLKDLTEKLAIQKQSRISLESKVARVENDYVQKETKLTADLEKLRSEKDALNMETQKLIAREKQLCKQKISQFEKKMSDSDKQKAQALFEKEKQQARWKMERNTLDQKIDQFKQLYEREQNETKKLLKENEKLKAEKKKNTSFIKNQTTIMTREISNENKENSQMQ